ncbi:IS66 family transposase [Sinorhizobium meliloti]|uniref:IS66 family transposase n=1 Tax=Rhizobium meliloti TaxID=382 RepID=UPI000FD1BE3F|nr:IS66 family transposase [Sinorhizobium meliloti]RVK04548.1 IS66 family transposase [Sinorhizobium meliloti]RVL44232.1 IS66 family transposase [Sinorhizobium meliloti]RVL63109.1 IS66 family transposase [Sinorhizobium meliloti]RVP50602.1 IS66 family transposase [Sinorhizobium meliloti]RVP82801.1 IS66 family transposase [Sinorhizobium meliloti]
MTAADLQLPDDVDALKAMILAMAEKAARAEVLETEVADLKARNTDADEQIAKLKQVLKAFNRYRYGRRSEKQSNKADTDLDEQGAFVFEEIETGIAAIEALVAKGRTPSTTKRASRPRKGFPPHLERIHVVIEPDELPEHAGKQKILIGEDTSERLDVIPPKFRVIVTHRPKYAFKNEDGVIQALAPAHIVESGIPTEALLAFVAVSKYGDGLPLYRQEAIFLRDHVEVDRGAMARWMGKLGFELEILADYTFDRIKEAERIFADETTLPTLVPGSGSAKTAYLWAYARDDRPFGGSGPPMVAYRFEDNRSGDCVARHLDGYRGILQIDGYAAYNRVARPDRGNDGALLAGCWAHSRRRFYELHASDSSKVATATIEKMGALWAIEEKVRGQSPDRRVAARQETSAAIVADLYKLWRDTLPRISGKSKLAEAIRYALNRRETFEQFLRDGRIEIDSNIVERAIRPQAIVRKNSLFAGNAGGGRTWATIATLIQCAKMNDVDPLAWLTQTLERIAAGWPASDIEALMPWKFQK